MAHDSPVKFLYLSIIASILTIVLKGLAYYFTGSVGLLSDALESLINLVAAVMALVLLTIALRPPDRDHLFGHSKAEYFSSVLEGSMVLVAAVAIGVTAIERIRNPRALEDLGLGLAISVVASAINLFTSIVLLRAGRRYNSITLEADARHLMTDVWTTGGVLVGLLIVKLTGWTVLDPVIAIVVALNIVVSGIKLIMRSVSGLMDKALPKNEIESIEGILKNHGGDTGIRYHSLYTRKSVSKNFIFLHLVMPGTWQVRKAHSLSKTIEKDIRKALPGSDVFIHFEPVDDPDSFDDYLDPQVECVRVTARGNRQR